MKKKTIKQLKEEDAQEQYYSDVLKIYGYDFIGIQGKEVLVIDRDTDTFTQITINKFENLIKLYESKEL